VYYIIVYDVEEKRVNKVCKLLRRYLHWVQNSVFEGELSEGKLAELKFKLSQIIDPEVDSNTIIGSQGYDVALKFQSLTGSIQTC